jgi:hypothetical protein
MVLYDKRGSELGWLAAEIVPWLRAVSTPDDLVLFDYGMRAMFRGLKAETREGKAMCQPDMIGPCLKQHVQVVDKGGCPVMSQAPMRDYHPTNRCCGEPCGGPDWEVLFHARNISRNEERNWGSKKWSDLNKLMPFGVTYVGGPADLNTKHNVGLSVMIYLMQHARLVVGASSGPIVLAVQLGVPVVTWSGNAYKDRKRYEEYWNPHGSKVTWVADSWDPEVESVHEAIIGSL